MNNLKEYIVEKLKIDKDIKIPSSEKHIPQKGEKVVVLYKDNKKNFLLFGEVMGIKNSSKGIDEFTVEYTLDGKSEENWFFYIPEKKYNFIGAAEIPQASIYTYEYALKEVNRILKENDDTFDGKKFTDFAGGFITVPEFFKYVKDIIEKDI